MANFERAEGVAGAGFDDSKYSMTMPLNNRRAVWLYGGGPKGEQLVVESSNPNLRLIERQAGETFFTHDGPNCRRDVITHEFFHLLGVGHGIDPTDGPTIHRFGITPDQSLNSADNLAQLTGDITTSRTDCCTRKDD